MAERRHPSGWSRPRWWVLAVVQVLGAIGASWCFLLAVINLPESGFWGEPNEVVDRAGGVVAAVATGVAAVSGPLLLGLVRRDRRWVLGSGVVAAGIAATILWVFLPQR